MSTRKEAGADALWPGCDLVIQASFEKIKLIQNYYIKKGNPNANHPFHINNIHHVLSCLLRGARK
jgi:hypothetical protein